MNGLTLSPFLLEFVNAVLLVIYLALLGVFGKYIIDGFIEYGWHTGRHQRLAGIAMFVFIFGEAIIRMSVWFWRHAENHKALTPDLVKWSTFGTAVGVIIAIFGGLCLLRVFVPPRFGLWPAIFALFAAILFWVVTAL